MSNILLKLFGIAFVVLVLTGIYMFIAGPTNLPTPTEIIIKNEPEKTATSTIPMENHTTTPTTTPRTVIIVGTSTPTTTEDSE